MEFSGRRERHGREAKALSPFLVCIRNGYAHLWAGANSDEGGGPMKAVQLVFASVFILVCSNSSNAEEHLSKIKTIVVIYAENRSFDHLYGLFPGANGIANATAEQKTQLDHDGTPLPYLTIFDHHGGPDPRFPQLPNEPFRIDAAPINVRLDQLAP